ncbi:tyrosine-type recombinase/integrase [Gulosibacter bifidus]|uniref:Tyrosine-type recombinase/integrase n=1 Tax=Gulosibacter bifidus TaxID=272239 RepID=A0ABW5RID6_9MICO|nr:site-specific integrase [Gulosibacter bifidus]
MARVMLRTFSGKRRQLQRIGATETKAKTAVLTAARDYTENAPNATITSKTTLKALGAHYLQDLGQHELATATVAEYTRLIDVHVKRIGSLRIRECSAGTVWDFLEGMRRDHGYSVAKTMKTVLSGMFDIAVRAGALDSNPARQVKFANRPGRGPRGAQAIPQADLPNVEASIRSNAVFASYDLTDLFIVLLGCGLRIGEACALRWQDWDANDNALTVAGTNIRVKGEGIQRQGFTKSDAGDRKLVVPDFVASTLNKRERRGEMVFCSVAGGLLDPVFVEGKLRDQREAMGWPKLTTHAFRKTVATLLDDAGLSARQIADYLGHSKPSMTTDVYMARKRETGKAAEALTNRFA